MADIRPTSWQPAQPPAPAAGRTAAQRAFFDAAMGRTPAPPTASPTAPPRTAQAATATATPAVRPLQTAPLDPEPPKKILRPGSLVDIRV